MSDYRDPIIEKYGEVEVYLNQDTSPAVPYFQSAGWVPFKKLDLHDVVLRIITNPNEYLYNTIYYIDDLFSEYYSLYQVGPKAGTEEYVVEKVFCRGFSGDFRNSMNTIESNALWRLARMVELFGRQPLYRIGFVTPDVGLQGMLERDDVYFEDGEAGLILPDHVSMFGVDVQKIRKREGDQEFSRMKESIRDSGLY